MTKRGTCTECGRQMHVRADGLMRLHRNPDDERCSGGHRPPQAAADGDRVSPIPTRDELRTSILNRVDVFTTRVDWIGGSADIAFADSVIALAEWLADIGTTTRPVTEVDGHRSHPDERTARTLGVCWHPKAGETINEWMTA